MKWRFLLIKIFLLTKVVKYLLMCFFGHLHIIFYVVLLTSYLLQHDKHYRLLCSQIVSLVRT